MVERMPAPNPPTSRTRRMRARKACEPCRERKRKCDGNDPCTECMRFEYVCSYVSVRKTKPPSPHPHLTPVPPIHSSFATISSDMGSITAAGLESQPLEANSGATFVTKLALSIDPANAPRSHLFAWNLFMGARTLAYRPRSRPITATITQPVMETLASVYLASFDPCYGCIDRDMLQQRIHARWEYPSATSPYDAVLCGIAALGNLFSCKHVEFAELDLIETARELLEHSTESQPSVDLVTGWVLRVAYLRMTASPHVAWMASCSLMHIIDASGILSAQPTPTLPSLAKQDLRSELYGRLFGIARHLNIWISYDLGRSRVVLQQARAATPSARTGDYTTEVLGLLPLSESLDPSTDTTLSQLKDALWEVVERKHSQPPSVLAQTNLALCIYRRLRALDFHLAGDLLDKVLTLTSKAIVAAQTMLSSGNPWHHVANVPFQIVCVLLAIDNAASLTRLGDAMKALSNAAQIYNTPATNEAVNTACLLVLLHQKRKDQDAKNLSNILQTYTPSPFIDSHVGVNMSGDGSFPSGAGDTSWLDDLMIDMPNLQGFDVGNLLDDNFQSDLSAGWV